MATCHPTIPPVVVLISGSEASLLAPFTYSPRHGSPGTFPSRALHSWHPLGTLGPISIRSLDRRFQVPPVVSSTPLRPEINTSRSGVLTASRPDGTTLTVLRCISSPT